MSVAVKTSASFTSVVRRMLIRMELLPTAKWYYYGCPGYLEPNPYVMPLVSEYINDAIPNVWGWSNLEALSWLALLLREEMEP